MIKMNSRLWIVLNASSRLSQWLKVKWAEFKKRTLSISKSHLLGRKPNLIRKPLRINWLIRMSQRLIKGPTAEFPFPNIKVRSLFLNKLEKTSIVRPEWQNLKKSRHSEIFHCLSIKAKARKSLQYLILTFLLIKRATSRLSTSSLDTWSKAFCKSKSKTIKEKIESPSFNKRF